MQTVNPLAMHSSRTDLVAFLREHHLGEATAWVLDILGPLNMVLAQFIQAGSVLLRPTLRVEQVNSLTQILEDPIERQVFLTLLLEDDSNGN